MILHAILFGILILTYIKPDQIKKSLPISIQNYPVFYLRLIWIHIKQNWLVNGILFIFCFLFAPDQILTVCLTYGIIILISLNILTFLDACICIFGFFILNSLPVFFIIVLYLGFKCVQFQPALILIDYSQSLLISSITLYLFAGFPVIAKFSFTTYIPLNRMIALSVFMFISHVSQELTTSKMLITTLKTRFHLTRLSQSKNPFLFLPREIKVLFKYFLVLLCAVLSISLYYQKTWIDHSTILMLSIMIILFEFDLLIYYCFQFKQSHYPYFLVCKGSELFINYLISSYVLIFGLLEFSYASSIYFSTLIFCISLIIVIIYSYRLWIALDFQFPKRIVTIMTLLFIIVGCSPSQTEEFVITVDTTAYFGKLQPSEVLEIPLSEITTSHKNQSHIKKNEILYRTLSGNTVRAGYDGLIEIRDQYFIFASTHYECILFVSELDIHSFRINESYVLESVNGTPLKEAKLTRIDYQYTENKTKHHDLNQFKLLFEIEATPTFPQSVVMKVPQPSIAIPAQFILKDGHSLSIHTSDGTHTVHGSYDAVSDTYDITTRLKDGIILYEVVHD